MTEKLFYQDSHRKRFTAKVVQVMTDGGRCRIELDRTAFFPEGGGQYADTGTLCLHPDGKKEQIFQVTDVQEENGIVWHYGKPVPGAEEECTSLSETWKSGREVSGEIDWQERFTKMQQHSGEHIVSGLVHARFGYDNVGFHLGTEDCTMDFNGTITKDQLREIEWKANEAVAKNLDILVSYPSREELATLDYRSKIEIEGQVRIVTVPGYDVCACCAPHVDKTGEIGMIKLTNVQRYKGGVRVTMLCGFRALADYDRKADAAKQISAALCAKEDETAEAVQHLKGECAALRQELEEQKKVLLAYKAKEVPAGDRTVCLFERKLEGDAPRELMNLVLDAGHEICAVFSVAGDGKKENAKSQTGADGSPRPENPALQYRYVIGSRKWDMRSLVKELNRQFDGRGGGKSEMVQGSLTGNEEELRVWIQKKGKELQNEQ
jgi:alanyl-tRNA synthetase